MGTSPLYPCIHLSQAEQEAIFKLLDEKGIHLFSPTTAGEFMDGEIGAGSIYDYHNNTCCLVVLKEK